MKLSIILITLFFTSVSIFFTHFSYFFLSFKIEPTYSHYPCHEQCCFQFSSTKTLKNWKIFNENSARQKVKIEIEAFELFSKSHTNHWSFLMDFHREFGEEKKSEIDRHGEEVVEEMIKFNSQSSEKIIISQCLRENVKFIIRQSLRQINERLYPNKKMSVLYFYRIVRRVDVFNFGVHYYIGVYVRIEDIHIPNCTGERFGTGKYIQEFRTFHVYQRSANDLKVMDDNVGNSGNVRINFITAIKNRKEKFLQLFKNYQKMINFDRKIHPFLPVGSNLRFIFYDYNSTDMNMKDFFEEKYSYNEINEDQFVLLSKPFVNRFKYDNYADKLEWNKVRALENAISYVKNDYEIIFIADVDMIFPLDFAERIRANVEVGKTVYIPECFSTFQGMPNENSFERGDRRRWTNTIPFKYVDIDVENGWWRFYGTGMIGFYKKDFKIVGGYDKANFGCHNKWGLEDTDLMIRFVKSGYDFMRMREMKFFHSWHPVSRSWIDAKERD